MWQLELANVPVEGWVIYSDENCFFNVSGNTVVLPTHNTKIVQGVLHGLWCSCSPWWVMVLSCVPCIFHHMFCQTHQCTLLHNLPFHICTCILLHLSWVWCPCPWDVLEDLCLCFLLWITPPLHNSCRCFCRFPLNLSYMAPKSRTSWCYCSLGCFSFVSSWC